MNWFDVFTWVVIGLTWVMVIATHIINRRIKKMSAETKALVESTHAANWIAGYVKGYQAAKAADTNEGN